MQKGGRREIVLVGGGHAHVLVLEGFAADPPRESRVTVVVDRPVAIYSGMVPGFVAGQYRREDLEIDLRPLARRARAEVVTRKAVRIDAEARRIVLEDAGSVAYDVASVNIGSTVAGLDLPGVREHALPTRPIGDFVTRVDELIERAQRHGRETPFVVVVVGGGSGGVELAFTIQQRLAAETGNRIEVVLVENGPRIMRGYPSSLVRRVERIGRERSIKIRLNTKVTAAGNGSITLADGSVIACHALVWVTGAVSHPLFVDSGLSTDDRGFVRVRSTFQFAQYDNLLAVGDCASFIDYPQTPKAGVYAVREGPLVTRNIRALLSGEPLVSYTPQRDFLTLLNLGDGRALGAKWGRSFEGRWVMTLKDKIDRKFMKRFASLSAP